jgi:hypothetical protein
VFDITNTAGRVASPDISDPVEIPLDIAEEIIYDHSNYTVISQLEADSDSDVRLDLEATLRLQVDPAKENETKEKKQNRKEKLKKLSLKLEYLKSIQPEELLTNNSTTKKNLKKAKKLAQLVKKEYLETTKVPHPSPPPSGFDTLPDIPPLLPIEETAQLQRSKTKKTYKIPLLPNTDSRRHKDVEITSPIHTEDSKTNKPTSTKALKRREQWWKDQKGYYKEKKIDKKKRKQQDHQ